MARPLRIEYTGAIYHLTSRGNARDKIFLSDTDRLAFLKILGSVTVKYNWLCHSYCLMDNHYHLLIETSDPTLSMGMRQLNGVYTQRFNNLHKRVGHLFQGRYKSILVQKGGHLLELCRYVVLNPVRAAMVKSPKDWNWSSYRATAYSVRTPDFLSVDWVLGQFAQNRNEARKAYRKFVADSLVEPEESPWKELVGQIIFGGKEFVIDIQSRIGEAQEIGEILRTQRFPGRAPLDTLFAANRRGDKATRNKIIKTAHLRYGYTLKEIADELGLHYTTISKALT